MANLRVDKITSTETFETTGSVQFDASSGTGLVVGSSDCDFGTGDFTIEGWFLVQDSAAIRTIFDSRTSDNTSTGFFLGINTDDTLYTYAFPSGATTVSYGTPEPNTWHHVAVARNGSDGLVFLDGKLVSSGVKMGSSDYTQEGGTIGQPATSFAAGLYRFKGHISNFRVIKGVALYTSNFKPSMRELEVTAETVLLACQSKTDASLEKTGKTITVNGNAVANELTPGLLTPVVKSGGGSAITGSVEFDGNDDYLQVAANSDLSFTGDFTVEYWVYMSKSEADMRQIGSNNYYVAGKNGNWYFGIHNESTPNVYFYTYDGQSNAESVGVTYTSSLNSWYHLAAARVGNTLTIYVNGVKLTSGTISKDLIDGSVGGIQIGRLPGYHNGFISNLRIVKGTALYTDSFTPPTRELKRVPGTVLLCCQDPNNPLTEVTGKTITGYGDLQRADGVELIANGHFSSNTDNWTAVGNASLSTSSGQIVLTGDGSTGGGGAAQGFATIVGKKYVLKYEAFSGTISAGQIRIGTSANSFSITFDNSVNASAHDDITFVATSTTTYVTLGLNAGVATSGTFKYDNVSVTLVDGSNKGSNFTPQVGDDRQVTFEGVTKINSDAYFCLPTGNTESREATGSYSAGTRGVMMGGIIAGGSTKNATIDYWTMASTGNALDFGDCTAASGQGAGVASRVRGVNLGGFARDTANFDYITIMSTGNALDFGDLPFTHNVSSDSGFSNETRGVFHLGLSTGPTTYHNIIDYITISSTGNAQDFGDTTYTRSQSAGLGSPTRGVWAGGYTPSDVNSMDYVTIASTGNAQDFGDLTYVVIRAGGSSNATRGVFLGGKAPALTNAMSYITIATTGNGQDFGDLIQAQEFPSGTSSSTRGVKVGGSDDSPGPYAPVGTIEYFEIATTGNAQAFGDLSVARARGGTFSNGHGGLG